MDNPMLRARFASVLIVGIASALVASACSDDASSSSEAFAQDYCNLLMPCCSQAGLGSNPSDCRMMLTYLTSDAQFNSAKANACLSAMRAASSDPDFCELADDTIDDQGACNDVFEPGSSGTVPPGGACSSDSDCAKTADGEGECYHHWEGETTTETCVIVAEGKAGSTPCIGTKSGSTTWYTNNAPPALGYICDEGDQLACSEETQACEPQRQLGESCSYSQPCVNTAYCDMSSSVCESPKPVGGDCSSDLDACDSSAYCDDNRTCSAKLPNGTACTSYRQCEGDSCTNAKCEGTKNAALSFFCGD